MIRIESNNKNVLLINKNIALLYLLTVCVYVFYMIFGNSWFFDWASLLIFMGAMLAFYIGMNDVRMHGGSLSNVFMISYFGGLAMNCLNLSQLQEPKNLVDAYYFFVGPIIFYYILRFGENRKIGLRFKSLIKIDPNKLGLILYFIYLAAVLYLFSKVGIRFVTDEWSSMDSKYYVVPGLSGFVGSLRWVLLILLPEVKTKYKVLFVMTAFISGLLMAKRGDAIRVLVFALMYIVATYKIFKPKMFMRFIVIVFGIMVLFSEWGDYRQLQRGWEVSQTVGGLLNSSVENNVVNWIYGYVGINYDVMKQFYIEAPFSWEMKEIFLPIIRIIGDASSVEEYYDDTGMHGLNGFNAAPFIANFIYELGPLYIFDIALLGGIVSFLSNLCMRFNVVGGRLLLMMITALCFSGNYYLNVNLFYALLLSIMIYGLIDTKKEGGKKNDEFVSAIK